MRAQTLSRQWPWTSSIKQLTLYLFIGVNEGQILKYVGFCLILNHEIRQKVLIYVYLQFKSEFKKIIWLRYLWISRYWQTRHPYFYLIVQRPTMIDALIKSLIQEIAVFQSSKDCYCAVRYHRSWQLLTSSMNLNATWLKLSVTQNATQQLRVIRCSFSLC